MKTKNKHLYRGITDTEHYIIEGTDCNSNGQHYYTIKCPFCNAKLTIPCWCLNNKGFNCECGALVSDNGKAHRLTTKCKRDEVVICNTITQRQHATTNTTSY